MGNKTCPHCPNMVEIEYFLEHGIPTIMSRQILKQIKPKMEEVALALDNNKIRNIVMIATIPPVMGKSKVNKI